MGERAASLFPNLEQLFVRGWAGILEGVDEFGGPGFRSLLARLQSTPRRAGQCKQGGQGVFLQIQLGWQRLPECCHHAAHVVKAEGVLHGRWEGREAPVHGRVRDGLGVEEGISS